MIAGLLDHLWQSTLFLGGIILLSLLLRRNGAALRFKLWFAASVKFLLPFSVLALVGDGLGRLFPASLPQSFLAIQPAAQRFSAPARSLAVPHSQGFDFPLLLLAVWVLGAALVLGLHLMRWLRLRAAMSDAREMAMPGSLPVAIKISASTLEPGLVGLWRPVIMLPHGLMAHLSAAERDSILAHEVSHLARRDNVTAAVHMLVEALFWFHPAVWLIGARLVTERERACDESVLAGGHDPEIYAGGILKVCRFCMRSPLACAPGASGADLKRRVREIMTAPAALELSPAKHMLLMGAAMLALVPPILAGFPNAELAVAVQRKVVAAQASAQEAVTAVAAEIGMAPVPHVPARKLPSVRIVAAPIAPMVQEPAFVVAPEPAEVTPPAPAMVAEHPAPPPAPPTVKQVVLAISPSGDGDPEAVTCRVPQQLPGSRLPGPQVCKTNRIWAELRANREEISPDGKMIVTLDDFQRQKSGQPNCRDVFFSRAGAMSVAGPSSTFCF